MSIDRLYASQVRDETGLFANWLPNSSLNIGHYGPLHGVVFQPFGELKAIVTAGASSAASYDFTIHATRKINTDVKALADAGVSAGKVLLEVSFQKEAAVTFSAPETRVTRVDDLVTLGKRLLELLSAGNWNPDHAIVVEVVTANRATIIASSQSGAEVKFAVDAETPVNANAMANLNVNTSLVFERGVGARVIGEGPLTPLFRLAFLKRRLLGEREIHFRETGPDRSAEKIQISDSHLLEIY
jgi:hypothetical protein